MKRNLLLTHGAALVAGICLALAAAKMLPSPSSMKADERHTAARTTILLVDEEKRPQRPGADRERKLPATADQMTSRDFREAWNAIAHRDITIAERVRLQNEVLAKWALVDLKAALRAAYDSPWDDPAAGGGLRALSGAFLEAFKKDPAEAWELLRSDEFRLGSGHFQGVWRAAAKEGPIAEIVPLMARMPKDFARELLMPMLDSIELGATAKRDEILRALSALPPGQATDELIRDAVNKLPSSETPDAVLARLAVATTEGGRTLALHQFTSTLWKMDSAAMQAEISKLPPELRARAAAALLASPGTTLNATAVLDVLIASGQVEMLASHGVDWKIRQQAQRTPPEEMMAWAMKLPAEPDAAAVFSEAFTPFLQKTPPPDALGWIENLPPGWHRDRALLDFLRHSVKTADTRLYDRAQGGIADPRVRAELLEWRRKVGMPEE